MQVATVGLDVAKQVFQVHGARPTGRAPRHRPERPDYGDGKLACLIIEDGEDGRRDQDWNSSVRSPHPESVFL
jgi:hypothetical protein